MWNFVAFAAVAVPICKRAFHWPSDWVFVGSFMLAFGWMMLCERLYQKRSWRKGNLDLKFLALLHFAPTPVLVVVMGLLALWLSLVH